MWYERRRSRRSLSDRPGQADDVTPETREPVAAPRPPGSFLRQIAHHEQVKYRYDPETGNVDARLVEPTEPVVTAWDRSSPAREQRDVGAWDVVPNNDGVDVTQSQRVSVPESVKAQLRREAERTGGPVTRVTTMRYQHDLDTRDTSARVNLPSPAAMGRALEAQNSKGEGDLNDRYKQMSQILGRVSPNPPREGVWLAS